MKTAVVTVAVGKALEWLDISRPSMEAYAKRVGAEFVALTNVTCPPFPCGEKWQLFGQFDQFDRILFVDADVVIRPTAPDLFNLVPEDKIGVYDELPVMPSKTWLYAEFAQIQKDQKLPVKQVEHGFNTGLVMSSRRHREIWRQPQFFRPTHTYEQSLINLKIDYHGFRVFPFSREVHWEHWIDREKQHYAAGQFLHFSGIKDHNERVRLMREAATTSTIMKTEPTSKTVTPKKKCGCGRGVGPR